MMLAWKHILLCDYISIFSPNRATDQADNCGHGAAVESSVTQEENTWAMNENLQAQRIGLNLSNSRRCRTYCIPPAVIVARLSAVPLQPPAIPASASIELETSAADQETE